ncbi:hypothetical protein AQUCO_05300107v1 [Aquilegia coerulea]|uniref:Uncharacterized protein n=1 Tax=Aquilegia coerulea TaxID=218851 RepID=A0A2G5CID9_AQUCA|nr:hypothetical protein AQUCO_05300107v1 [Aquilegia coerulea]
MNHSEAINQNVDMIAVLCTVPDCFASTPDYGHLGIKMGSHSLRKLQSKEIKKHLSIVVTMQLRQEIKKHLSIVVTMQLRQEIKKHLSIVVTMQLRQEIKKHLSVVVTMQL